MPDANSEGFPICDERITENDRCVIKIIGIHCKHGKRQLPGISYVSLYWMIQPLVLMIWSSKQEAGSFSLICHLRASIQSYHLMRFSLTWKYLHQFSLASRKSLINLPLNPWLARCSWHRISRCHIYCVPNCDTGSLLMRLGSWHSTNGSKRTWTFSTIWNPSILNLLPNCWVLEYKV